MNTLIVRESFDLQIRTDMVRGYLRAFDTCTGHIYKALARMPPNKEYTLNIDLFSVPDSFSGQFALDCACDQVKEMTKQNDRFLEPWELVACEIAKPDLQENGLLITTEHFMLGDSFSSQGERVLSSTKNFGEYQIGPDVWFAMRRLTDVDRGTFGSLVAHMRPYSVQSSA
jgi:hypothetical protein